MRVREGDHMTRVVKSLKLIVNQTKVSYFYVKKDHKMPRVYQWP